MRSILIKDTTREEREQIVREALEVCGDACSGCSSCGCLGGGTVEELYRPYIEGELEIREINERYRKKFVK